jgi:hydroxypyruvate isomerase
MPKFAANISTMFTEVPLADRFAAAAEAGFRAVEIQFPYELPSAEAGRLVAGNGLANVLFNLPQGDAEAGERGLAALPGREEEFRDQLDRALTYAEAMGTPRLHVLAGVTGEADRAAAERTYVANLAYAAGKVAELGLDIMIEPLNHRDMPGYFLTHTAQAVDIIGKVGAANLKVQFDIYHRQVTEGDLIRALERFMPHIGHVQIAGVPDRHEPDTGEVRYEAVLEALDALGYEGWVGAEYWPAGRTEDGLGWFKAAIANSKKTAASD